MQRTIRQIAYFTDDIERSAHEHSKTFGSGPYFVQKSIPVQQAFVRGVEGVFDHGSAYGQWGPIMIEFVQQNTPGPSPFHDMYPEGSGRYGLHHVAIFVDDLASEIAKYESQGHAIALLAKMSDTFSFAMIDTVHDTGHMLELYEPEPTLVGFYEHVRSASEGFNGENPIRNVG